MKITTGRIKSPHLLIIYGTDGVGKTTFAAEAPAPVFIGPEAGTKNLDVARFETPGSFESILTQLHELATEKHEFNTVAIDSLDWIEPLIWAHVCRVGNKANIEDFGYGKGFQYAMDEWTRFRDAIKVVQEKRHMNVVLIAHSEVKAFNDPQTMNPYDRYQIKLNKSAAALMREYVDSVLFATFEVYTKAKDSGVKGKAYGDGARVMYTERRPGFDAKNRLGLPHQIPLSWAEYVTHAEKGSGESAAGIIANIQDLTEDMQDKELFAKIEEAVVKAGNDVAALSKVRERVRARVGIPA